MILLPGCPCCGGGGTTACDCLNTISAGGNTKTLHVVLSDSSQCDVCIADAVFLVRVGTSGCLYGGYYDLTSCVGDECTLYVTFTIGPFPACQCNNTMADCDYFVESWETNSGACVATSVTLTTACP